MTRELVLSVSIHDCEVQTFRSGGKGGQNQNKRDTGVRVIHHPSGSRGESREERSQLQNKKTAFRRMVDEPSFRYWLHVQTGRIKSEAEWLAEQMRPENIRVEIREGGTWAPDSSPPRATAGSLPPVDSRWQGRQSHLLQELDMTAQPNRPVAMVALKSTGIAYVLWLLLGVVGGHKFYLGRAGMGVIYLFTLGLLGVGVLIDLFTLPSQVRRANAEIATGRPL